MAILFLLSFVSSCNAKTELDSLNKFQWPTNRRITDLCIKPWATQDAVEYLKSTNFRGYYFSRGLIYPYFAKFGDFRENQFRETLRRACREIRESFFSRNNLNHESSENVCCSDNLSILLNITDYTFLTCFDIL